MTGALEVGRILEIALLGKKDDALIEMKGQYAELKSSLSDELLKWRAELEKSDLPE